MRLIDADALVDALMAYTWRDEDERLIDDADEKREYIKQWLPDLPTVGGWISVKDRLPDGKCVAYSEKSGEMLIVQVFADDKSDTGYTGESEARYLWDVTHWMPMPDPPKEESEDD